MINAILLLIVSMQPVDGSPVVDSVDLLEVNKVVNAEGEVVLNQLLGWEWHDEHHCFDIVFWRLIRPDAAGMIPCKDHRSGYFYSTWHDGDHLRRVRSRDYVERYFTYDIELRERRILPECDRRKLKSPHIQTKRYNRDIRDIPRRPRPANPPVPTVR